MTTKLNDFHYVLLAIAAKRANGSILPLSTSIGVTSAGLTRRACGNHATMDRLRGKGLLREQSVDDGSTLLLDGYSNLTV
jgi:hypothetical protein